MKVLALVAALVAASAVAEPAEQRGSTAAAGQPTTLLATAAAPIQDAGFMGFPIDKVAHAAVSAAATPLLAGGFLHAGFRPGDAILLGAGTMLVLGMAKELADLATTPRLQLGVRFIDSVADFAFDAGGCAAGAFAAAFLLDGALPQLQLQLRGRSLFLSGRF